MKNRNGRIGYSSTFKKFCFFLQRAVYAQEYFINRLSHVPGYKFFNHLIKNTIVGFLIFTNSMSRSFLISIRVSKNKTECYNLHPKSPKFCRYKTTMAESCNLHVS